MLESIEGRDAMPAELTLSFQTRGVEYSVKLRRVEGAIGPNYKELHVDGRNLQEFHHSHEAGLGDPAHTRAPPRLDCFYHGYVEGVPGSHAAVAACRNGNILGSVLLPDDTLEIQGDGEGGHVGFFLSDVDAKEFGTCGVEDATAEGHHARDGGEGHDAGHHHSSADVLHGMGRASKTSAKLAGEGRGLAANECANSPNKYVEILAVSDESFYALKGDDVENCTSTLARRLPPCPLRVPVVGSILHH